MANSPRKKKTGWAASLNAENHFLVYIVITAAVAVLVLFALFMVASIQTKIQTSEEISQEQAQPAAVAAGATNSTASQSPFNQGNDSSTNGLSQLFQPGMPATKSN